MSASLLCSVWAMKQVISLSKEQQIFFYYYLLSKVKTFLSWHLCVFYEFFWHFLSVNLLKEGYSFIGKYIFFNFRNNEIVKLITDRTVIPKMSF